MMNELTVHTRTLNPMIPQTFEQAERAANLMATAKLVPPHFQKSPADCLMVIQLARQWNFDPMLLAQECYSISGKLMVSGKLAAAAINANAGLSENLNFEITGDGDKMKCRAYATIAKEGKPRDVEVIMGDVKTSSEQWKKQPDQQLCYSAARKWGRRHTPEIVLGVVFVEEAESIAPAYSPAAPNLPPMQQQPVLRNVETMETIDPQTGEVIDTAKPHTIVGQTWGEFVEPMTAALLAAPTIEVWDEWMQANQDTLVKLKETKPDAYKLFDSNIAAKHAELTKKKGK